jgi:hypothetical protein
LLMYASGVRGATATCMRLLVPLCTVAAVLVFAAPAAAWTAAQTGPGQLTVSDEVGTSDAFTVSIRAATTTVEGWPAASDA